MSKGFDMPSNKHLGKSHDYWKVPQNNSKQIVVQPLQWLPIDRDENGFATEECTKEALKQLPIVIRGYDELGEYHHLLTEDSLECDKMAIFKFKTYTHYLPIPKLGV